MIALGGGAYLNRNIRKQTLAKSTSFWLNWNSSTLIKRIKDNKKRPLVLNLKINDGKELSIKPKVINKDTKRLWGMNRSILSNAIIGANTGYTKILELSGVGFRAALKGKVLNLQLGFSHDINFDIPDTVKITVEKQTIIKITGSDKQEVGMITSKIKSFKPPEPYKGKGIKEQGQYILRKEGKKK